MIGPVPICMECEHLDRDPYSTKLSCRVFPDGIPNDIAMGRFIHTVPYPNPLYPVDKGIRFEPLEEEGHGRN